nr:xylosyltransferase [Epimedium pubescens]
MNMEKPPLHIAMFPWFAMGHLLPFLRLSNILAEKGHQISFFVPTKTQSKLNHLNFRPKLVNFIPLVVPHVEGLPLGSETMSNISIELEPLLATALDLMQQKVEKILQDLKPDFVFYDFAYWIPKIARPLGIKSIFYSIVVASQFVEREMGEKVASWLEKMWKALIHLEFGIGVTLPQRLAACMQDCDAIAFRGCHEIEGTAYESLEIKYGKQVLVTGPVLDEPCSFPLEERWDKWLRAFSEESVVYCAFGSEWVMTKEAFQELVLGLEFTGLPFFVALKPPHGMTSVEEAFPAGFAERVKGRGVVYSGWVQQKLILNHPSVGCFVTHCGASSMWESLVSDCQIVALPQAGDQFMNANLLTNELKVGVEIERRDEDGWFTREGVRQAVEAIMNQESEVGIKARENHAMLKDTLLKKGLESAYLNNFVAKLQDMV